MISKIFDANASLYPEYSIEFQKELGGQYREVVSFTKNLENFAIVKRPNHQRKKVFGGNGRSGVISYSAAKELQEMGVWAVHYLGNTVPACFEGDELHFTSDSGNSNLHDIALNNGVPYSCLTSTHGEKSDLYKNATAGKIVVPGKGDIVSENSSKYLGSLGNLPEYGFFSINDIIALLYSCYRQCKPEPHTDAKIEERLEMLLNDNIESTKESIHAVLGQADVLKNIIEDTTIDDKIDNQLLMIIGTDAKSNCVAWASAMRYMHAAWGDGYYNRVCSISADNPAKIKSKLETMSAKERATGATAIVIAEHMSDANEKSIALLKEMQATTYFITSDAPSQCENILQIPDTYTYNAVVGKKHKITPFGRTVLSILDAAACNSADRIGANMEKRHRI